MAELTDFLGKIRNIQSLMVRASTGPLEGRPTENEYQELYIKLKHYFNLFGIPNPNGFSSLDEFHGYWAASLPHWKDRRDFIRGMYEEVEKKVSAHLKRGEPIILESRNKEVLEPVKILFLTANPGRDHQVRFDKEIRGIEHNILRVQKKDQIIVAKKLAVRVNDLQLYLNQERPNIVHFSGHGTEQGDIVLEDEVGNAKFVKKDALAMIFKLLKDDIQCVVLNACFSSEQAKAIFL